MNLAPLTFPLGRAATVAMVVCFLASGLLETVLLAGSSSTNSVGVWPFTPPAGIAPPQVRKPDRVANGIDHFILEALEEKGLSLAPAASARTLVRRL